ncbi:hypothetical protein NKH77_08350 [Streptomyces sp. M19]
MGPPPGLALGHATAALGSVGVVVAAWARTVPLLLCALFVYGAGTVTGLLARYAGADLAPPGKQARATGTVLLATTLGAVAGPRWSAPPASSPAPSASPADRPFLLAAVAYTAAALVVALWLRPDPLLLSREQGRDAPRSATGEERGRRLGAGVVTGAAVMISGQVVMIAIMTMTPVHLTDHGHSTQTAGS